MMDLILHFGVFFLAFVPGEVCFPAGKRRETGAVLPPRLSCIRSRIFPESASFWPKTAVSDFDWYPRRLLEFFSGKSRNTSENPRTNRPVLAWIYLACPLSRKIRNQLTGQTVRGL